MPRNRYLLWKRKRRRWRVPEPAGGIKGRYGSLCEEAGRSLSSLAEELEQLGNRITLKEEEIDQARYS